MEKIMCENCGHVWECDTRGIQEKKSYVEQLSEQYGWPLKIKARGYIAHLCDIQPLNADEKPIPVYRFPGGRSIVSKHEMVPADTEKAQPASRS